MTGRRLGTKRWLGLFGGLLALMQPGCMEQTSVSCTPGISIDLLHGMVSRQECTGVGMGPSTLIRIDAARPNSELWVMEEPTATPATPADGWWWGALLNNQQLLHRSQALVQINGFLFECGAAQSCYWNVTQAQLFAPPRG